MVPTFWYSKRTTVHNDPIQKKKCSQLSDPNKKIKLFPIIKPNFQQYFSWNCNWYQMTWSCRQKFVNWGPKSSDQAMENPKKNRTKGKEKREPREGDWCSHEKGLIASLLILEGSVWRLGSWGCVFLPWSAPNSFLEPKPQQTGTATGIVMYCGLFCCAVLFLHSDYE